MTRTITRGAIVKVLFPLGLLAILSLILVVVILFVIPGHQPQKNHEVTGKPVNSNLDNFGRGNGTLGSKWTNIRDGGLSVSSHAVKGKPGVAGDIWTASAFTSNQYSQIEVTSTQLTGIQWIGTAVRAQSGGRDAYVGVYFWNSGRPELLLYKRSHGNWISLGGYSSGPLAAGTRLRITAVGSTISFLENGIQRLSVSDSSLAGGAPGIIMYGSGTAGNWRGGDAPVPPAFRVTYLSTDAEGVRSYQVISADNGPDPQVMRVLTPTHPAAGMRHNFLYVLTVQPGLGRTYSDGLETLRRFDAQNKYNLTIIEPTYGADPWYADNPKNPNIRYETFFTKQVVPWVEKNLATTGHEQNWLIGFSKSGLGGQDLILKHPDIFSLAASWDFPAELSSYDGLGGDTVTAYGTDASFQANYRLTAAFVKAHSGPFLREKRIWIGGGTKYTAEVASYATMLTKEGLLYTRQAPRILPHTWDSGWMPEAVAALEQDSTKIRSAA